MLHGNLGPKLYRCTKCENVTQSYRGEWPSKSRRERRWFVQCSAVFVVVSTMLATYAAVEVVGRYSEQTPDNIWIVIVAGTIGLLTALWQGGRVFASLQRDGNGYIDPRPVSFWTLESNALWTMLWPFLVAAVMVGWKLRQ